MRFSDGSHVEPVLAPGCPRYRTGMRDAREHPVDGGILRFDRRTGLNVQSVAKEGSVHLRLTFENMYAGSVAIEAWLRKRGYTDVELRVDDVLAALTPSS